jgi:DNA repair protein RadD
VTITLYPDQQVFIDQVRDAMRKYKRVIAQAYCGFGKTVIAAEMTLRSYSKGNPVLFAVHRKQIRRQTILTFNREGIPVGQVGRGLKQQVMVGTMQAIKRRMTTLDAKLVFIDEGHIYASGFAAVHEYYASRGAWIIALTATPTRFNNKGMRPFYEHIVEGPTARWLIDNGRLSDYKLFAPQLVETDGLHTSHGEFVTKEVESLMMDKPTITGDAIKHWRDHANGKRTLMFCASINHSRDTADKFRAAGIAAAHMDANTPDNERQRIINDFADGRVHVISNCMLASEGFDLSAQVGRDVPVEAVVMLRPTKSLSLYVQMAGRALRKKDERAIILDHVGNCHAHGLPDFEHAWSLDGREKKKKAAAVFTCKVCYGTFANPFKFCPNCGEMTLASTAARGAPEQVDGELRELDRDMLRKRPTYDLHRQRARTLEELIAYGRSKGMKNPEGWAKHVNNARQAKRA